MRKLRAGTLAPAQVGEPQGVFLLNRCLDLQPLLPQPGQPSTRYKGSIRSLMQEGPGARCRYQMRYVRAARKRTSGIYSRLQGPLASDSWITSTPAATSGRWPRPFTGATPWPFTLEPSR